MVENPPWLLKHGWRIQTKGGDPGGGSANGADTGVPQDVLATA
jgi:hypothetical protein